MNYNQVSKQDIEVLQSICGQENVMVKDAIHPDYTHDEMTEYGCFDPEVVIQCQDAQEVAKVLAYANQRCIPVTTRGAGTGLCGGCVPIDGGIVLSVRKMNRILEIDMNTLTAVVEPGVLLMELAEAANQQGLLYAPDPGEKSATVGGNVMTNAGGMRAIKYGVTRDYVRGMEVVLAHGEIVTFGGKIVKNSSGYSLKDLMIGSEGTLGIVTKLMLKLLPKPKKMVSLLIPFDNLKVCLELVPKIMQLPVVPTTIEFMEKEVLDDAQQFLGKDFPNRDYNAYLIVSYSGNTTTEIDSMIDKVAKLALANQAVDVFISDTKERQENIWSARGAFLEAIKNSTTQMDECDVVVGIDRVAEFVAFTRQCAEKYNVRIRSFGHAGDGNLHVYVCKDQMLEDQWRMTVKACMDDFYQLAIQMGGQVSGEHGIGHAKKEYLKESVGETQIQLMKQIKAVFDPKGILNPSKIVD